VGHGWGVLRHWQSITGRVLVLTFTWPSDNKQVLGALLL